MIKTILIIALLIIILILGKYVDMSRQIIPEADKMLHDACMKLKYATSLINENTALAVKLKLYKKVCAEQQELINRLKEKINELNNK